MKNLFTCGLVAAGAAVSSAAHSATYAVLHDFSGADGSGVVGDLIRDSAGNLYGVTGEDSACASNGNCGVIYELSPPPAGGTIWSYTVLHHFSEGAGGSLPNRTTFLEHDKKNGLQPYQRIKLDRQIVAVCKAAGVEEIYTDDGGLAARAVMCGMSVVHSWDLPMPPTEAQGKLSLEKHDDLPDAPA